jgi:hypothetical protein
MYGFAVGVLGNQGLVGVDGPLKIPATGTQSGQRFQSIQLELAKPLPFQRTPVSIDILKIVALVQGHRFLQKLNLLIRISRLIRLDQELLKDLHIVPTLGPAIHLVQAVLKDDGFPRDGPPEAIEGGSKDAIKLVGRVLGPEDAADFFFAQSLWILQQEEK